MHVSQLTTTQPRVQHAVSNTRRLTIPSRTIRNGAVRACSKYLYAAGVPTPMHTSLELGVHVGVVAVCRDAQAGEFSGHLHRLSLGEAVDNACGKHHIQPDCHVATSVRGCSRLRGR